MTSSSSAMTPKEWMPLIGLTFSAFIFNTSEFMPIGLLTDIAVDLSVTEAHAGMLITVYSWAVMLLSLPLMMLASRVGFRKLLLATVAVFCVGQLLSVLAPSFALLMAARICVACAHAVFWSIASPMAVRVVSERHSSLALSMIVTGTSVAMILGLPLGRVIGLYLGWRLTFLCIAVASLATLAYLAFAVPKMSAGEPFTLKQLPGLLRRRSLVGIYAVTALTATAYYTGYSYIEPFLQQIAHMDDGLITAALTVFGVAGIGGSLLFARFYDGHRRTFLTLALSGVAVALLLMGVAAASPVLVMTVCVLWGAAATSFNVAFQGETIAHTPQDASAVAMSIYSGIFNLGIGGGTWIGGAVTSAGAIGAIGYVGGAIALVGVAFFVLRLGKLLAHREEAAS